MVFDELSQFIQSNPDPRELKRTLAVQMVLNSYKHRQVQTIFLISFVPKFPKPYCFNLGWLKLKLSSPSRIKGILRVSKWGQERRSMESNLYKIGTKLSPTKPDGRYMARGQPFQRVDLYYTT